MSRELLGFLVVAGIDGAVLAGLAIATWLDRRRQTANEPAYCPTCSATDGHPHIFWCTENPAPEHGEQLTDAQRADLLAEIQAIWAADEEAAR